MKISHKYPVIRHTWNYGNFVDHIRFTYNNLLPKVDNYSAPILKTKAKKSHITNNSKKSHMENSIKVTLFNSLKSSFSGDSVLSYG